MKKLPLIDTARLALAAGAVAGLMLCSCGSGHHNEADHDDHGAGHTELHDHQTHHDSEADHDHQTHHDHEATHDHQAHHDSEAGHDHEATHDHQAHHDSEAGHDHEATHDHGSAQEAGKAHSDEIVIPAAKAEAAGIRTETIVPGPFAGVIRTGGEILPATSDEVTIVASTDGILTFSASLVEGTPVGQAQQLFTITSSGIQDGSRIAQARIAYETAKAEYERAASLVESRIVSQKDFARIKAEYEAASTAYMALKPNSDGTGVRIESPASGYVCTLYAKEGDYVTVGTPLADISRDSKLHLRADVSQRYLRQLSGIESANFKTAYADEVYNVRDLGGKLLSIARVTPESSYYLPVTFEIPSHKDIVPGTFAEIWLLSKPRENVISVPVQALTEEQGLYFAYIRLDEECYRKQEVKTGQSDGARTEILSGLKAGDEVVVEGAMNVKLASASNAIPAHSHNH